MKVAIFSDVHHGLMLNDPKFHQINLDFYDWFLSVCREEKVDQIWCGGDVFHNRKEINLPTMHNAFMCFDKLKEFDVKIIVGNHDAFYLENCVIHSLDFFKNWTGFEIFDELTYRMVDGRRIAFIPWVGKEYQIPLEKCDMAFVHMELIGFEMDGITASHGTSPKIFDECPLVVSGHFHKTQDRSLQKTRIYYAGSPYQHNWGELENKYVHILDLDDMSLKKIENTISPKHHYIRTPDDYSNIPGNFVRVMIDSDEMEKEYDELFSEQKPLDVTFDRKVKDSIQTSTITDFKNVSVFEVIEEYIEALNEDCTVKESVKEKNKVLYEKASKGG